MKIATWNLRGLIEDQKQHSLLKDLISYNLDIVAVQETHLRGTQKIELGNKYTFYNTGPTDHSHHGVGIIVKNSFCGKFQKISDRICQIEIKVKNNTNLTIISAYAPTLINSKKFPERADKFYKELQLAINKIPQKNLFFIGIDANAQLGIEAKELFPNNVGHFGHGHLNSNGERLGQLLNNNNLTATNTLFNHKIKHRITWTHPNQNPTQKDKKSGLPRRNPIRNQIDYIIAQIKLKDIVKNSRSYHGTRTDSDHNIVICKIKLEPFKIYKNKEQTKLHINLDNLEDKNIKEKYQKEIKNNINKLQAINKDHSYSTKNQNINYTDLTNIVKNAGIKILGTKPKNNKFSNNKIKELSEKRFKLKKEKELCNDLNKGKEIQKERNKLRKDIRKEIKSQENKNQIKRIKDIEKQKNDSRRMYQAVREINKKEDNTIIIENSKNEIIHNTEKEIEEITKYFENIFTQENTTPIPEIKPQKLKEPISSKEIKKALTKIKNNKSPGCDELNAELLKESPEITYQIIADILNNTAETGDKPLELSLGLLIPLPKPNKPKGPVKNLRPIILLSIIRKILAIIITNRTFETIRNNINISQAAYSPGRSTTELVFSFKILIEQAICAKDFTIHLLMLDMSRAFDTIDRGILLSDLEKLLEPDILHLVSLLLTDVKIQVKYKNKLGKVFQPDIGSPQGDCASPIWFIFYLHKALEIAKAKFTNPRITTLDTSHDHPYSNLNKKKTVPKGQKAFCIEQQYADDTSWITTSEETKEKIKEVAPEILINKNLIVNADKTEEYTISRKSNKDWKKCKFLGSLLGNQEDITRRKQLANVAFAKNKKVLCSKRISLCIRLRIFEALVASIFLYNSELWTLSYQNKIKIDTFQRQFLRQILRSRWIRNTTLYKLCNTIPWSVTIKQKRLNWFGHFNRLPWEAPVKQAFAEAYLRPVKKLKGGQPLQWMHTIKKDFKTINISTEEALKQTKDRKGYGKLMDRVMAKSLEEHPDVCSPESKTEE